MITSSLTVHTSQEPAVELDQADQLLAEANKLEGLVDLRRNEVADANLALAGSLLDLAWAYQAQGRLLNAAAKIYKECEALLDRALGNHSTRSELKLQLWVYWGDLLLKQKRYSQAQHLSAIGLAYVEHSQVKSGWTAHLCANLGDAQHKLGLYPEAQASYEQAINICKELSPKYDIIGIARAKLLTIGQSQAEDDAHTATALNQHLTVSVALFEDGRFEEVKVRANLIAQGYRNLNGWPSSKLLAQLRILEGDANKELGDLMAARTAYQAAAELYQHLEDVDALTAALQQKVQAVNAALFERYPYDQNRF